MWQWRAGGLAVLGASAAAVCAAQIHSPIRAVIALVMIMVGPGGAVVLALDLDDPLLEWATTVALSLAISALTSTILLYAHVWSLPLALGLLEAVLCIGLLAAVRRRCNRG